MIPRGVAFERTCALVAVWVPAFALFLCGPALAQIRIYPGTGQSCPAGTHLLMLSSPNYPDCQCDTPASGNLCDLNEPSTACFCLPDPQIDTLVIDPRYWVLTILHAPPGRASSVTYGASSTTGSRVEVKGSLYNGFDVKVESSITEQEQKFETGTIDGVSVETHKTAGSTMSLDAQDDAINYGKDTFVIWTNPRLTIADDHLHPPVLTLSVAGGGPPQYINVTVEELSGDVAMPAWKKALLANISPADISAILALDPFAVYSGTPHPFDPRDDPKRFAPVGTLQVVGPDHPGDPLFGEGVDIAYDSSTGTIKGYGVKTEMDNLAGGKFTYGVELGIKEGLVTEYQYENTTETIAGEQKSASVTLKTPTPCWHQTINVWYDAAFGSYAFTAQPNGPLDCADPPDAKGRLTNAAGLPMVDVPVTLHLSDGSVRPTFTNGDGIYKAWSLPAGAVTPAVPNGAQLTVFAPPPARCMTSVDCNGRVDIACRSILEPIELQREADDGSFVQIGSTSSSSAVIFHDTPPGDAARYRICSTAKPDFCGPPLGVVKNACHECPPGLHYCGPDTGCVAVARRCE